MNERNKESLSALMDGEADELEVRRILNQLDKNDELYESWKSYHLMGSVMREEHVDSIDLTQGINKILDGVEGNYQGALSSERVSDRSSRNSVEITDNLSRKVQENRGTKTDPAWYKPLTSVAVAASVTLAVLVGVQNFASNENLTIATAAKTQIQDESPVSPNVLEMNSSKEQQIAFQVRSEEQQKSLESAQQQLQDYILNNSSTSGERDNNTSPFARVVEFEKGSK